MQGLDRLYVAMQAGGDAEGREFFRALADAELFLLLESEAQGQDFAPQVFAVSDGRVLLAFDTEERLAGFSDGPMPYAALPGRVIVGNMAGQGLSLGLNLGTGAASEVILPPEVLAWLMQMLDQAQPEAVVERISTFERPIVPQALLQTLPAALTGATCAYLVGVRYHGGRREQLLAVMGVSERNEARVAKAVNEALAFSGIDAGAIDLAFVAADDAVLDRMAGLALVFEPPKPQTAPAQTPKGRPGPPKLR